MAIEPAHLRFIACPACSHQFTWLGSRLPSYCCECGKPILNVLERQHIHVSDPDASVRYNPRSKVNERLISEFLKQPPDQGVLNND